MQYQIKWIKFLGKPRPVVLQVVNGPCPIIALCSVLFLRGELVLKPDVHEVSFEQLCALLRGHLQHSVQTMALRPGASEEAVANALQNLEEVTALLPRLEQGLDINVRFNSPSSFEFTPELSLFDLAGVRLLHGWCYDSEDRETARVLSNMSYNELVNFITSEDAPPTPAKPRSARDAAAAAAVIAAATAPAAESAPTAGSSPAAQPVAADPPTADKPSAAVEVPPAATEADAVPASAESLAAPAAVTESGLNASAVAAASSSAAAAVVEVAELKEDLEALHIESQSAISASSSATAAAPAVDSASSSEPESASASSAVFFPSTASASAAASTTASSSLSSSSLSSSPPLSTAALEAKSLRLAQTYQDKNVARAFLNDTQSQLTIAGLSVLHSLMRTDELAVLFRNNHYAVLLKHNERLYTLVSDFGLLAAAPYIVWSFVSDTQGDHLFLDHDWKIPHPTTVDYWQRQDQRQPTAAMAGNHSPMPPQQQQQQQQIYQPPPQQQQQQLQQQYRQQRPQSAQPYGRQQYQQQPQQPAPRPVPPQRKRDSCVVQ